VTPVMLGMLLVGIAGAPAHAETIREQQWFLDAMKAEQMWQVSTGKGITVAVIDSGVAPATPDLKGQVLPGKDYAENQSGDEHTDYDGHGTGMAALIAGTGAYGGGTGSFGLAPGAKILPIRMPKSGTAANQAEGDKRFNKFLPKAIHYAADADAKVINISLARSEGSPQLTKAVKYALDKGALIFAGVGNEGDEANQAMYPAATPGVVGVGAVGRDLRRTDESQYGPQVDMAAPGEDIVAACAGGTGFCKSHGTSDATAIASASAALIWSKHPTWTNNQVLKVMLNTIGAPTDGSKRNDSIGYGIVRPRIALQNPGDPGPADEYPLPDLAAAASASPSPQPSATDSDNAPAEDKNTEEAAASDSSKGNNVLSTVLAAAAVVALLGIGMAVYIIARNRNRHPAHLTAPHPTAPYAPPPGQPQYPASQYPPSPYAAPPSPPSGNITPGQQSGPG
jgi:type VII secretion-associated serine protease mycosin